MPERLIQRDTLSSAVKAAGGLALFGSVIIGAPYVALSDNYLDLLGDGHRVRSQDEMEQIADRQVEEIYVEASASERYGMLYLNNGYEANFQVGSLEGGDGVLGLIDFFSNSSSSEDLRVRIGQGCLAGTSYDTLPSEFYSRGIFHSVRGEISAIAAINRNEEGLLSIIPAATNAQPLTFIDREGSPLQPADEQSQQILDTYGCEPAYLFKPE